MWKKLVFGLVITAPFANAIAMHPPEMNFTNRDKECMATALYHEARGEPKAGQKAVLGVILERAKQPRVFGNGVCGVVFKKGQFSWTKYTKTALRDSDFDRMMDVVDETLMDSKIPCQGTRYFTSGRYSGKVRDVCVIGRHRFYNI